MFTNAKSQPNSLKQKQACIDIILSANKDKIKSRGKILQLQKKACEKYKTDFVTNPMLLVTYKELVKEKKIKPNKNLFEILRKRRVRTQSGIASVAVLTKPYACPGNCVFCPTQKGAPKSYITNEPAVMRAVLAKYDPTEQINIRLRGFELAGNSAEKIELIVMGGTFSYLPRKYQLWFVLKCFEACNKFNSRIKYYVSSIMYNTKMEYLVEKLKQEQKRNEKAKNRIIGLTLETRPDYINEDELKWFRELGCTRVEIGVQSIFDDILKKNNRGHLTSETVRATKLLKDAGFKICYHLMPNLWGSDLKKDKQMFKVLFSDSRFQPDMIKIYPCVVTKYSELANIYKKGKYKPYTDKELINLLIDIKRNLPPYVRIQRLIRDIPAQNIVAGSKISNLRQIIHQQAKGKVKCQCIRCREIREDKKLKVVLNRIDYNASDSKEIFLQYIDKNNQLYALLRLRMTQNTFIKELKDCAIIREVHTYGQLLNVGEKTKTDSQHKGLGKKLILEAERIAKNEFGYKKIAVISGIGVRSYYKKLGYKLSGTYLVKQL